MDEPPRADTSAPVRPVLDCVKIRHYRVRASLTVRQLALRLAVSATTIERLEAGTNHDELNGRFFRLLADELGVALCELMPRPQTDVPSPAPDDIVIEAALACLDGAVPAAALAQALGWELGRVRQALAGLAERSQATGQRVHDAGWQKHRLRPATEHLTDIQQRALHQLGPRERGLTTATARLLMQVKRGEVDDEWRRTASNADRVTFASLLDQGLVEIDFLGRPQLTGCTAYALAPHLHDPDGGARTEEVELSPRIAFLYGDATDGAAPAVP